MKERGYTIPELLIAVSVASVIMVVVVSTLFSGYISVLAESREADLRTEAQSLLINMQDELLFTIGFSETTDADLDDAYEPTGGWQYDSVPETLIINEIALDSTRRDDDRDQQHRHLLST